MDKYAIVQLAGKQFRIQEGDQFVVDKIDIEEGKDFEVEKILLIRDGKNIKVGTPLIKDASVKFKLLEQFRSKKLRVAKFKAKSRYRRVKGHRQHQSKIEAVSINY
jgi:large subunit ribosomal protein L21